MTIIRLIVFLFVAGTFNVLALVLVHTLPALQGWHQEALAVTAAFVLLADVILLWLVFFRLPSMKKKNSRFRKFEDILSEEKSGKNATEEEFQRAYRKWNDRR